VAAAKVPNIPPILLFGVSCRKPEAGNVRCRFVRVLIVQKRGTRTDLLRKEDQWVRRAVVCRGMLARRKSVDAGS